MGFFDNVSKQVTTYSQKAVQKTKDVSEIMRINAEISDEEKKIDSLCLQIGKQYYSTHKDTPDGEFMELLDEITSSEKKICQYKKEIQDIKGIDICAKCGAEVPKGAMFCSSCGTSISDDEKRVKCPSCGAIIKAGIRFCTSCGAALTESEPDDTDAQTAESDETRQEEKMPDAEDTTADFVQPSDESAARKNICSNCGAELDDDDLFCTNCGAKNEK